MTALSTLELSQTQVADIAPLSGLTALATLYLSGTRVESLTPLSGMTALATLSLSSTRVKNLAPLSGLSALATLQLSGTEVVSLAPLASLSGISTLYLSNTPVTDIAPLSGLSAISTLELNNTPVTDIAPLSGLPALATLDLSDTRVESVTPLSGLTALTTLDLSSTRVADIGVLLAIPAFAEERADYLNFQDTPAADPERDRRLYMLSRLDGKRCAVETVQYLKGTHPNFRDPPGGAAALPLVDRLAMASPVGFDVVDNQLSATNPLGAPERLAPKELALRVGALRTHVAMLQADAEAQQVPRAVIARLNAYAASLQTDEPTYILLDGPMSFLRGSVADAYVTDPLDKGFVEAWCQLVTMHDELRPLLLPPAEADTLPPLSPAATPEEGIWLTDQAIKAAEDAEGPGGRGQSVAETLRAAREFLEAAKANEARRSGLLRKGVIAVAGTIAALYAATGFVSSATSVAQWLTTPQGQAFLVALRPVFDALKALFGG